MSISGDDSEGSERFNVHKFFVAHGARRSEYFSRLIRSKVRFHEKDFNTSVINLDPLAAKAFPALLDYV